MSNKIISIIPARGGSKGIEGKNIKKLYGIPLVAHSIKQSISSKLINQTYVSTEDQKISMISNSYGANIINRPRQYATDSASTESVLFHASEYLNHDYDYMVLLQPTSPLRYAIQIDQAINKLLKENADSLLSVYENDSFLWSKKTVPINYDYKNRPRRQDKEWEYVENGSIYITKRDILLNNRNRLGGKIITFPMPKWMSYEIDTSFDFELIEYLMETRYLKTHLDFKSIIKKLKIIIFDIDGVFTDGSVFLNKQGDEMLKFSRIDGKGVELLRNQGFKTAVITSEDSNIVKNRMEKLKIDDIYIGITDKQEIFGEILENYNLKDENACFLGDDIQDLEIINKVGFSCCPNDAQDLIKKNADYISSKNGGQRFVRDVANLILDNL